MDNKIIYHLLKFTFIQQLHIRWNVVVLDLFKSWWLILYMVGTGGADPLTRIAAPRIAAS